MGRIYFHLSGAVLALVLLPHLFTILGKAVRLKRSGANGALPSVLPFAFHICADFVTLLVAGLLHQLIAIISQVDPYPLFFLESPGKIDFCAMSATIFRF